MANIRPPILPALTQKFTAGRCPPGTILAIVLHEYNGSIEQLDAEMGACSFAKPGCHQSFHYGIGPNTIHQYVLDANTAWSIDCTPPCPTPPPGCYPVLNCNCCVPDTWAPRAANPNVDPNCYTLNIALSTGVSPVGQGCQALGNIWTSALLNPLSQLLCWLSQEYDIELVDGDTLYRHCSELGDLPIDMVIDDVEDCIDAPPPTGKPTGLYDCQDNPIPVGGHVATCTDLGIAVCTGISGMPTGAPVTPGVTLVVGADCQLHTIPTAGAVNTGFGIQGNGQIGNVIRPDFDQLGNASGAPSTFKIVMSTTAQPDGALATLSQLVSGTVGNVLSLSGDGGLYVAPASVTVSVNSPLTGNGSGGSPIDINFGAMTFADQCAFGQALSVAPLVSIAGTDNAGCLVKATAASVFAANQTPWNGVGGNGILLTSGGTLGHAPTIAAKLSGDAGNNLAFGTDGGLFVPPVGAATVQTALGIKGDGGAGNKVRPDFSNLPAGSGTVNTVVVSTVSQPDGAGMGFSTFQTLVNVPLTVTDTNSVDLTSSGSSGHTLQADVKISAASNQALTVSGAGLYVPTACSVLSALSIADPSTVANLMAFDGANACVRVDQVGLACEFLKDASATTNNTQPLTVRIPVYNSAGGGSCGGLTIQDCSTVTGKTGTVLGVNEAGTALGWFRPVRRMTTQATSGTASAAFGGVVVHTISVDNEILTLNAPSTCGETEMYIKVKGSAGNRVRISGPGGTTIDGAGTITLTAGPTSFGGTYGEAVHIFANGTDWIVL